MTCASYSEAVTRGRLNQMSVSPRNAGQGAKAGGVTADLVARPCPFYLEPEDGHDTALGAELARVAERADRAQTGGRILGADAGRDPDPGPPTDA